jgi:hypothetical protein
MYFSWGNLTEREFGKPRITWKDNIKYILKKSDLRVWIALKCLRVGPIARISITW